MDYSPLSKFPGMTGTFTPAESAFAEFRGEYYLVFATSKSGLRVLVYVITTPYSVLWVVLALEKNLYYCPRKSGSESEKKKRNPFRRSSRNLAYP